MNRRSFIGRFTGALAALVAAPKMLAGKVRRRVAPNPGPDVLAVASQRGMVGTLELEVHNEYARPKGERLEMTNSEGQRAAMPLGPEVTRAQMRTEFSAEAASRIEWRVLYDEGKGMGEEELTGTHYFDHDPESL